MAPQISINLGKIFHIFQHIKIFHIKIHKTHYTLVSLSGYLCQKIYYALGSNLFKDSASFNLLTPMILITCNFQGKWKCGTKQRSHRKRYAITFSLKKKTDFNVVSTSNVDFLQIRSQFLTLPISDAPKDLENGASATKYVAKAEAGTAEYLIELEERRSIKVIRSLPF